MANIECRLVLRGAEEEMSFSRVSDRENLSISWNLNRSSEANLLQCCYSAATRRRDIEVNEDGGLVSIPGSHYDE